jgi:hypothetical protein
MIKQPTYTIEDVTALEALSLGVANEGQQKRALKWIMSSACGTLVDETDTAEAEWEMTHAAGRRFVAIWINKLLDPGLAETMRKAGVTSSTQAPRRRATKRP